MTLFTKLLCNAGNARGVRGRTFQEIYQFSLICVRFPDFHRIYGFQFYLNFQNI